MNLYWSLLAFDWVYYEERLGTSFLLCFFQILAMKMGKTHIRKRKLFMNSSLITASYSLFKETDLYVYCNQKFLEYGNILSRNEYFSTQEANRRDWILHLDIFFYFIRLAYRRHLIWAYRNQAFFFQSDRCFSIHGRRCFDPKPNPDTNMQSLSRNKIRKNFSISQAEVNLGSIELLRKLRKCLNCSLFYQWQS